MKYLSLCRFRAAWGVALLLIQRDEPVNQVDIHLECVT